MKSFAEFFKTICVEDFAEDSTKLFDTDIIKVTSETASTPKTPNLKKTSSITLCLA